MPDDFSGTCGDALMLLALNRIEQENRNQIASQFVNDSKGNIDMYTSLMTNPDIECAIAYNISQKSDDGKRWESL